MGKTVFGERKRYKSLLGVKEEGGNQLSKYCCVIFILGGQGAGLLGLVNGASDPEMELYVSRIPLCKFWLVLFCVRRSGSC